VAHEERPDTCLRARAGMRAGGAGVAACVRRQQRGVHAAVVARLPVSRDSSSEPESAGGATSSSLTRAWLASMEAHGGVVVELQGCI
jgi:hypothetical protein